jgi:hypothetical protein
MSLVDVERLREIAEVEFADIVGEAVSPDISELRIILTDGSFVDVWFSLKPQGRYSFHWERRALDRKTYRHDNSPRCVWWRDASPLFPGAALRSKLCPKASLRQSRYLPVPG